MASDFCNSNGEEAYTISQSVSYIKLMTSPGLGVGGEEGEAGEGGVAGHPELAPPQVHGEGPRGTQLHVHLAIRRVVRK